MQKLAIFASGNGSNAQRIAEYFKDHKEIEVSLILSNKADALVLERARKLGIPAYALSNKEFREADSLILKLQEYHIDAVVLAGFLLKVPDSLLKLYPRKIINIHPAILPKFGGKGMYGHFVHEAVIAAKEQKSGISIHLVNEQYDEGEILFQAECPVFEWDDANSLAARIHTLEHEHFPMVIEKWVRETWGVGD